MRKIGQFKTQLIQFLVFVAVGLPGMCFYLLSLVGLLDIIFMIYRNKYSTPVNIARVFGMIALFLASTLAILYGANRWREWKYLVIFFSFPLHIALGFALTIFLDLIDPGQPVKTWGILGVPLGFGLGMWLTLKFITRGTTKSSDPIR